MVPSIPAGNLFTRLTTDQNLNIRWLVAADPVYFEVLNRPISDITLRELILAKAVDQLAGSLGHQALFPFLVQPKVGSGTDQAALPADWIWDISIATPAKWRNLRLARIGRISGANDATMGYTGQLRLQFSASVAGSAQETILLLGDYTIDSALTYQVMALRSPNTGEVVGSIDSDEAQTVAGYITFRTLDITQIVTMQFFDLLAPPTPPTDSNNDGFYDTPAVYDLVDSAAGGTSATNDFSFVALAHGTGLMTDSVKAPLPALNADMQTWLNSFNYPFDSAANLTSTVGITLPAGLFREFNITAPAGDEPTGASSGLYFPVWLSRILLVSSNHITLFFSTHNVTETETGGSPSLAAIEFATLDLLQSYRPGEILAIVPIDNLELEEGTDAPLWQQHFGRGHVVLSNLWNDTGIISDFFSSFQAILTTPQDTDFPQSSGRLSSFGISRIPKYTPTIGQARALLGSTSRRTLPIDPGQNNRYITEADTGLGDQVDLEAQPGITPNAAIERYGFTGSSLQRTFYLEIDASQTGTDRNFYNSQVLPRIRVLLGRDPVFGDCMYNGVTFRRYNGDTWQD